MCVTAIRYGPLLLGLIVQNMGHIVWGRIVFVSVGPGSDQDVYSLVALVKLCSIYKPTGFVISGVTAETTIQLLYEVPLP